MGFKNTRWKIQRDPRISLKKGVLNNNISLE